MSNLNRFFEVCGIPQYVWQNAQEDSQIEPAEVAEYSAIDQTISTWWISNKTKPLYWKIDQLQAGFEELNIGRFFRDMLERHPPNGPLVSWNQLDLPGVSQTGSRANLPPPHNITVEYAEKQMSHNERHLLHMLSTFTNRPACVDEIAVATSLDASALLNIQAIYHDPKRAEWTTYAYHILITWYASSSKTQIEKLCKLREIYYAMGYAKNFDMYLADSKFEIPKMKKEGKAKHTPTMGVSVLESQNSFSPSSQISSGPNGEYTGKRILEVDGGQTTQHNANSGEEQLIAFGEATVEDVGVGTERNSRTVTFELSQISENRGLSTTSPPPLISSDNVLR